MKISEILEADHIIKRSLLKPSYDKDPEKGDELGKGVYAKVYQNKNERDTVNKYYSNTVRDPYIVYAVSILEYIKQKGVNPYFPKLYFIEETKPFIGNKHNYKIKMEKLVHLPQYDNNGETNDNEYLLQEASFKAFGEFVNTNFLVDRIRSACKWSNPITNIIDKNLIDACIHIRKIQNNIDNQVELDIHSNNIMIRPSDMTLVITDPFKW